MHSGWQVQAEITALLEERCGELCFATRVRDCLEQVMRKTVSRNASYSDLWWLPVSASGKRLDVSEPQTHSADVCAMLILQMGSKTP